VTICTNRYRIIGHPVCIEHRRYDRNQFIFNLCLVLDEDADFTGHKSVVKKLAGLLRNLEEQSGFLSKDEGELRMSARGRIDMRPSSPSAQLVDEEEGVASLSNSIELAGDASQATKMYALCEIIMEDLNNYCECMIPIGTPNIAIYSSDDLTAFRRCEYNQPEAVSAAVSTGTSLRLACASGHRSTHDFEHIIRPHHEPHSTIH
jgi:hypothetical protein